jgi:hypothetical protein
MGKVIFGAILGAGIGLFLGWLPSYEAARWDIVQPAAQTTIRYTLDLARLLHPLSMMIGTAAGGIIGAIAGRVAADPNTTPLPLWVPIAFLVLLVGVLLIGAIQLLSSSDRPVPPVAVPQPAHQPTTAKAIPNPAPNEPQPMPPPP